MKKLSVLCIALCVGASATAAFARGGMGAHGMGSSHMPSHSPSRRLDPRRLRLSYRLGEFGFRAHHGIKLLPDLAGHGSGPARADLAHVDEVIPFPLAKVQGGDAGRILHETDDRKFPVL